MNKNVRFEQIVIARFMEAPSIKVPCGSFLVQKL